MNNSGIPKRIMSIVLGLCLMSSAFLLVSCTITSQSVAPRVYIALGDSVSSGFGLESYSTGEYSSLVDGRHSSIFFENLEYSGFIDEYRNMAVSGYTTTMFLEMLKGLDEEFLTYFNNAYVITLNIGGNNILTPFLEYLSNLDAASGVGSLRSGAETLADAWAIIGEMTSDAEDFYNDTTYFGIDDVLSGIRNFISGTRDIVAGGRAIADGAPDAISILTGSLSEELEQILEEGVRTFLSDFNEIISWLEINAPNATIIINTIYNPIPQAVVGFPVALSKRADELINTMNQTIHEEGLARSFIVVDIHSHFENQPDLMRLNLNPSSDDFSFDIIHPNANGHILIARLHYDYFIGNR